MDYEVFETGQDLETGGKGCSSSHYILTLHACIHMLLGTPSLDNGPQCKQDVWVRLYCRAVNEHGMLGL